MELSTQYTTQVPLFPLEFPKSTPPSRSQSSHHKAILREFKALGHYRHFKRFPKHLSGLGGSYFHSAFAFRNAFAKATSELLEPAKAEDIPPKVGIREFVTGPDYLDMPKFWERHLEQLEKIKSPGIRGSIIEMGIGAGKTYSISVLPLYDIYSLEYDRLFLGEDLDLKYELDKDSPIYTAILTLSGKLARELFRYIQMFAMRCDWFKKWLPVNPKVTSEIQFMDPNEDGRVRYIAFPGHSKQSAAIGRNVYTCILDECNFFQTSESPGASGIDYAREMHDTLDRRIVSRFGMDGGLHVISSRKVVKDFSSMRRIEIQSDPDSMHRYYTPPPQRSWYFWPDRRLAKERWKLFDPQRLRFVTSEIFSWLQIKDVVFDALWVPERCWEPFKSNPEAALRDYASIPSEAVCPFMRRGDLLAPDWGYLDDQGEWQEGLKNPIKPSTKAEDWLREVAGDAKDLYEYFDSLVYDWFKGQEELRYHMHVDPSKTKDATGLALVANVGIDQVALSSGEKRPEKASLLECPLILRIKAPKGSEILFRRVREIIYWVNEHRGFRLIDSSYDGWQSGDAIQTLQTKGLPFEVLSVDKTIEPYNRFKEALYDGRFFFPPAHGQTEQTTIEQLHYMAEAGDPCAIFQIELRQLEEIDGRKIDHPHHGSKDLTDAVCGANWHASSYLKRARQ